MRREFAALTISILLLTACGKKEETADTKAGAPPPAKVEQEGDANLVKVDHPEQFPLATAGKHSAAPELSVTGVVQPDVARTVPVISLASGRVVEIDGRIGDEVKKGQILLKVQSADISGAFSDYRKAVVAERLTKVQLDRAKILYEKGAIAQKDLEVAESAENSAVVDVETTTEHLKVLGSDTARPTGVVDVPAPISGVIIEQNITVAGGVKTLDNSPNLFTIADLSSVWIVCDVFENDLPVVHVGEYADIHLVAYPNHVLKGRISNIGSVLDPAIRTAKVRLEVANPGLLRVGMFVTATFHGQSAETRATVPADAVLHLHDRDWVYVPAPNGRFRRLSVVGGAMLPGKLQEIVSGIKPGDQVVTNALVLQNAVEQQ
ncbi:MAG TPA: efflux RND transporter periplasmic adaptor subunit [Bryobacteraceae bacterium]|jgi:cobalt-zinc-cadmium efflux system membrane fusion protein|nr:efflux RND transporter periplasmic adaptor subunit [Bryobacteraceae bacterium]